MKPQLSIQIRKILREEEDGSTVAELADVLNAKINSVYAALKSMPDAYIDRWTESGQQRQYQSIWCIVVPPKDCPVPGRKLK